MRLSRSLCKVLAAAGAGFTKNQMRAFVTTKGAIIVKAYFVIIILGIALWYEYNHRLTTTKRQQKPVGVARSTGRGVRQATQFSGTGSSSPGSGVQTTQPAMGSTWGFGGDYGPGLTGPTYLPRHKQKAAAA
jgi:hypothetical protein